FAALIVLLAPSRLLALDDAIERVAMHFPPPQGFCELVATNASDRQILNSMQTATAASSNRLIAVSADCKELTDWRAGKRPVIDALACYQTVAGSAAATQGSYVSACAQMSRGSEVVASEQADWKAIIERANKGLQVNETTFAGLLLQDKQACYAALLQKVK